MIEAIVTDVEGTTSSLTFVKESLFPYARAHLPDAVRQNALDPEWAEQIEAVRAETDPQATLEEVINTLIQWGDDDCKVTPLKQIQGWIWAEAYLDGVLQSHVYQDVPDALKVWFSRGIKLYCYSSGSILAQQLFFRHTEAGDLTPYLSGYFDTTIGAKNRSRSYTKIAGEISYDPSNILFLSDVEAELDAAVMSGVSVCQVLRPGVTANNKGYPVSVDFFGIDLDACDKTQSR